jgi:hypothetical protein
VIAALSYPLQIAILSAIVVFSVVFAIARAAGLFGLFLLIVATVGLIQYTFIVFRASAMGNADAPPVSPDDFNPWHSPMPVHAAILGILAIALPAGVAQAWGTGPALIVAALMLLLLPASFALLAIDKELLHAVSPLRIGHAVSSMGAPYLLMPLALLAASLGLSLIPQIPGPQLVHGIIAGYVYFLAVHLMGKTLYRWRDRIGFEPVNSKILREQNESQFVRRREARAMEEAYHVASTDSRRGAAMVLGHLDGIGARLVDRRAVFRRMAEWPNRLASLWFAQDLLEREIRAGNNAEALALTARVIRIEPKFRPRAEHDTLRLAKHALENGQHKVVTTLLSDFAERYPDSASALPSMLMCAKIALEHTNERELARRLVERIEASGRLTDDPRIESLRKMMSRA